VKSSTGSTAAGLIAAGAQISAGAGSRTTSFSSLRNRVHLAVTLQAGSSSGATRPRPAPPRWVADGQVQGALSAGAEVALNPRATDPALRRTVQAVPNQLR